MAKLIILFETPIESESESGSESDESTASEARINGLVAYVRSHYRDMSCFDNLRRFYGLLSISEAKNLLGRLDTNNSQVSLPATLKCVFGERIKADQYSLMNRSFKRLCC